MIDSPFGLLPRKGRQRSKKCLLALQKGPLVHVRPYEKFKKKFCFPLLDSLMLVPVVEVFLLDYRDLRGDS